MLTRKQLRDMGVTDEDQITAILNLHKGEVEDVKEAAKKTSPQQPEAKPAEQQPAKDKPKEDAPEDMEALRRELAALKQSESEREKKESIMGALSEYKPKNAALLYAALDHSKLTIKDGKVEGLADQVTPLKKSDGYLFSDVADDKGGSDPKASPTSATMNDFIRGGIT